MSNRQNDTQIQVTDNLISSLYKLLSYLANGHVVTLGAGHLHLDSVHETLQLVPDIPGSPHGAELNEVLIAPLR